MLTTESLYGRPGAGYTPSDEQLEEHAWSMLPRALAAVVMVVAAGLYGWLS